ncbi:MAG: hypothetical protein Q8K50_10760 [Hydrogenophaga sp.]|nr:hypothetical protein [Hydrogenophaga sp.]
MKRVTATLITDGSSDKLLVPLIELIFSAHTEIPYQVNCAEGLPPFSKGLRARIDSALELFPCDFLFVHRDAEGIDATLRQQEIETNWPDPQQTTVLICVVPVRMTEAWLIANQEPIRSAVGNPNGTESLGLPAIKDIESSPDPKEILFVALKAASGLSASRKRRFNPHQYRHRVSELTDDLEPLRKLSSFRHLETQVQKHLKNFNS